MYATAQLELLERLDPLPDPSAGPRAPAPIESEPLEPGLPPGDDPADDAEPGSPAPGQNTPLTDPNAPGASPADEEILRKSQAQPQPLPSGECFTGTCSHGAWLESLGPYETVRDAGGMAPAPAPDRGRKQP
jgi:hypothetical protein